MPLAESDRIFALVAGLYEAVSRPSPVIYLLIVELIYPQEYFLKLTQNLPTSYFIPGHGGRHPLVKAARTP